MAEILRMAAILAAPAAVVFLVLVVADALSPAVALGAWLTVLAASVLVLRPLVQGLAALAEYGEAVADGRRATPPEVAWPGVGHRLTAAFRRLARADRGRAYHDDAAIAAHRALLDALPDPLLLLDGVSRVVFANRAGRSLLGDGAAGRDLAASLRAPPVLDAAAAVLKGAAARDFAYHAGAEPVRHYRGRVEALTGGLPDGAAAAMTLHDVTDLERSQRQRVDFVANASHEIRTPLATLIGAIETLQGPARDDAEARARFLGMMDEHARRILHLVDDLLNLSRIEMAEREPPSAAVHVGPALAGAVSALEWKAEARQVRFDVSVPDSLPPVTGDADELRQVFENLVDNAIKYGGAEGTVAVRAETLPPGTAVDGWRADSGAIAVTVSDTGPGIAPEHIPRLTERFYRVDTARSRQLGGTGLGLAIVKHIVLRHRGTMTIASEPGAGSRFTVYLPVRAQGLV